MDVQIPGNIFTYYSKTNLHYVTLQQQDVDTCLENYMNKAQLEKFDCTVPWNIPDDR